LIEDRERIAADLHDTVIQRLFATGLGLQATIKGISNPEAAQRVETAVTDLDDTIRQIRSTIFGLQARRVPGRGLRGEVLSLVTEAAASLGFEPHLRLDGPIDSVVSEAVATHLLAVLREALSNVVRHAHASQVNVTVVLGPDHLTLQVQDDGIGPGPGSRAGGRGMLNLAQRAEGLGGSMDLSPGAGNTGTVMTWSIPL
jgi:signal transduction histidine kinase